MSIPASGGLLVACAAFEIEWARPGSAIPAIVECRHRVRSQLATGLALIVVGTLTACGGRVESIGDGSANDAEPADDGAQLDAATASESCATWSYELHDSGEVESWPGSEDAMLPLASACTAATPAFARCEVDDAGAQPTQALVDALACACPFLPPCHGDSLEFDADGCARSGVFFGPWVDTTLYSCVDAWLSLHRVPCLASKTITLQNECEL